MDNVVDFGAALQDVHGLGQAGQKRAVVRYAGDEPEQPESEIDENTLVVHAEYVDAPLPSAATEKAR